MCSNDEWINLVPESPCLSIFVQPLCWLKDTLIHHCFYLVFCVRLSCSLYWCVICTSINTNCVAYIVMNVVLRDISFLAFWTIKFVVTFWIYTNGFLILLQIWFTSIFHFNSSISIRRYVIDSTLWCHFWIYNYYAIGTVIFVNYDAHPLCTWKATNLDFNILSNDRLQLRQRSMLSVLQHCLQHHFNLCPRLEWMMVSTAYDINFTLFVI